MKKIVSSMAVMAMASGVMAQNTAPKDPEYCGSNKQRDRLFDMHESYRIQDSTDQAEFSEYYHQYIKSTSINSGSRAADYIIPVVFHIVHLDGPENISDAQIYDALRILNEDFQKLNADTSDILSTFLSTAGNPNIEFRLATRDNSGQCHKGITRTYSSNTYDTGANFNGHPIVDDVQAAQGNWPQNKYMNVFVCIDPDGAAGYTLTPSNWLPLTGMYGGILIRHGYVGSIGTGNYQLARALTHEVGHWLNLAHPWGPNNNPGNASSCGDDDDVLDTPVSIGWTTCNLNGNSCDDTAPGAPPSSWNFDQIDNVQNYMDYSYCSRMFTNGQAARMHAALNSSTAGRNNLHSNNNLVATGTLNPTADLCDADFDANDYVICVGESIDFADQSYHNVSSWNWTFTGGSPASSSDQNPSGIQYNTPGTYNVSLVAGDGSNTDTETKTAFITVLPAGALPTPHSEGFESVNTLPNNDFFVENPNGDNTWEVTTAAAHTGSKSAYINNSSSQDGSVDDLISNTYDLSGLADVTITFDHAYAQRNSVTNDKLSFYVSNNCGDFWVVRKNITGANLATAGYNNGNFVPSGTSEWEHTEITNITSSYLTPNFRYRFEFTSDGGNNIYLDNINLTGPLGTPIITDEDISLVIYPNPATDNVSIRFDVPLHEKVSVEMKDMLGRSVATLMQEKTVGHQVIDWDASQLESGVYHIAIQIGNKAITKRVVIQ